MKIDINIYCDTLELIKGKIPNIKKETISAFIDNSDYYEDQILEELYSEYEDFDDLYKSSNISLHEFLTVFENKITFDYAESREMNNRRIVSFLVECDFEKEKYIEALLKEKNIEGKTNEYESR